MPLPCSVCSDRKRRPAIDAALSEGVLFDDVARRFKLAKSSLHRHAQRHLGLERRTEAKAAKPVALATAAQPLPASNATETPPKAVPAEPMSLRSPDDVLSALELAVAETRDLLAAAKAAGDLRLQNQLVQTLIGALDKLAKSVGLYSDSPTITVNTGERKTLQIISELSTEKLRALKGLSDEQIVALVVGLDAIDAG